MPGSRILRTLSGLPGARRDAPPGQPRKAAYTSKYSSNFRQRSPYLRVCHLTCGFSGRWFVLFADADRRLPEQRRNSLSGIDKRAGGILTLKLMAVRVRGPMKDHP
jgi:hypothetical protein